MADEQISSSLSADSSGQEKEKISLSSRKKWLWVGIIIAFLNPIFSGLILGIAFWTEPGLKKEGKIVLAVSVIWGLMAIYLSRWLVRQGYLPSY
jgi:formate/nitrite transporter FocA (FNT family)